MSGSSAVGSGRLVVGLAVVVAVSVLVLGGGSAWATTGHTFAGQFGGLGDGDGQFGEPPGGPGGVAVLASTGEVFTADAANVTHGPMPRVQRFGANGVFESQFVLDGSFDGGVSGLAVDPVGAGGVYVATGINGNPAVVKYSMAGVKEYELASSVVSINHNPRVAVDPVDGTVYVTATEVLTGILGIASFGAISGAFLGFFGGSDSPEGGFCPSSGLAVDGSHRVYVLDPCKGPTGTGNVERFSAGGVYEATVDLPSRSDGTVETLYALAVDPVSDEVYVAHSGPVGVRVTHFGAGGVGVVYGFDAREVAGVRSGVMAVSGAGAVYLSDLTRPFVVRYSRFDGPTVVTGDAPPASIEARSAVLEGTIDPRGIADSSYHFEYSRDQSFGSQTVASDPVPVSGSGVLAASTAVSGLRPNTTYYFRIVGSNASGSIVGSQSSFPTLTAPPDVEGTPVRGSSPAFVSAITPRSARLHGTVNPNSNGSVHFYLEYGTTTAYGHTVDALNENGRAVCFAPDCGGDDIPVIGLVSGLEPSTTYHFRVVAGTGFALPLPDPQFGADQTFVTAPAAGGGATDVTSRRARLTGTINPHGVATGYHFNYGPTSSYGASTPEVDAGSGDGEQPVAQEVSGLLPDTIYHVQVVATSAGGVVRSGADGLFRTARAPAAVVIGPTGFSTDAATLAGEINTFGLTGSYHFDVWSLDSGYAGSTPQRPVSGNAGAERVSAVLTGLPAGETFVVQLTVSSNDSTGVSEMLTFATAAVPTVFPVPPSGDLATVYGCGSPRLNTYSGSPKPGELITITGNDLGVGGSVVLGDRSLQPIDWSTNGFKVTVPGDVAGTLALTVNCGRGSNTVAVAVFAEPDNRFSIVARSVIGSTAALQVRVPGPGKIESSAANTQAAKVTVKKASTATVKVKLTSGGRRTLARAKSHTLKVKVRVQFTPAGGRVASKTVTVTFKRGSGRR